LLALIATVTSIGALAALVQQDPKRARVFHKKARRTRLSPRILWLLCLSPAVILPFVAPFAHWVMWFGTITVGGWGIAYIRPGLVHRINTTLSRWETRMLQLRNKF
jgi:hypothetical protein